MRYLYLFVLLVGLLGSVYGQTALHLKTDYQTQFEHLSVKNGLGSDEVLDIIQDKVGYLWLATTNGLNRYDGYQFLVYRNIPGDSTSLSSNLVTCIEEDIYGDLWIGTHYGLNKYNRKTNTFEHIFKQGHKKGLSDNYIRALHADDQGNLWIETVEGTLNKLHLHTQTFEHYKHQPVNQHYYYYHSIYQENDSTLWIGGRNTVPHRFNIRQGTFERFLPNPNDPAKKRDSDVACYFEDSQGNFYVTALDGVYLFDKVSRFQKIIATSTFSILEDKQHNLWFGTGNGVYKKRPGTDYYYHYTHNPNNPGSLGGNHVNKLYQDRSGVIWFATNTGLSKYSPIRKNFLHFYHIAGETNTVSANQITVATQDSKGTIWLGTANNGIDYFNPLKNTFGHLNTENTPSLSSNRISALYFDKAQTLWVGLWSGLGINKFNAAKKSFTRYAINYNSLKTDWYNDILETSDKTLYFAVWGGYGLYTFDKTHKTINPFGKTLEVIPTGPSITGMHLDKENRLWLAQEQNGIDNLETNTGTYTYYRHFKRDLKYDYTLAQLLESKKIVPAKIPSFTCINQILTDRDSTVWLATNSGLVFKNGASSFEIFKDNTGHAFNSNYSSLAYDSIHHILWLAKSDTLQKIDLNTNQTTPFVLKRENTSVVNIANLLTNPSTQTLYFTTPSGAWCFSENDGLVKIPKSTKITTIALDSKGQIWMANADTVFLVNKQKRIQRYFPFGKNKKITAFTLAGNHIFVGSGSKLYSLNPDADVPTFSLLPFDMLYPIDTSELTIQNISSKANGQVFIGTNKGLFKYYTSSHVFHALRTNEANLSNMAVHLCSTLKEDLNGDLWVGTTNTGLNKIEKGSKRILQFVYNPLDTNSYWGDNVNSIYQDSKGRLWIAGFGLNLYHPESNRFTHFTTANGLPSNTILSITEDNHQDLWLGTNKGLSRFTPETESFKNYYEADGIHTNSFTKAVLKLSNGSLLFGSNNGFIVFNPDSLKQNLRIPPVVLTRIKIFENEIFEDLSQTPELILKPKQNTITFEFSALDYNHPPANKYAYKLEGIDQDWIETDANNRSIRYTNLPPGKFTFLLRGSNNNGVWGNLSTPVSITIKAPFWQRWWFIVLSSLLFIVLIILAVLYREKELIKEKKTRELEHRFLRAQMNPHFIFNSLSAIQSYIFKQKPLDAGTYLSNFSELVRSILDNSRHEFILLDKEITTLRHYLQLQKLRFPDKLSFHFEIDEHLHTDELKIPPMMLQPFIENSIEHGFKKTKKNGEITIRIRKEEDILILETEDNGIGILASEKEKTKKEPAYHSLATKITRERIQNMNRRRKQKIILTIVDLSTLDPRLRGTRVSIRIPLKTLKLNY